MSKKGLNQQAVFWAMSVVASQYNHKSHAFGSGGNIYPINNKRGYASKDKRKKK